MKVDPLYSISNNRQFWRIIPAGDKIIIEERDPLLKEVFFSCIELESGKYIFRNYQLSEKFWIGVEAVYNGIIYFHKYAKPDMPGHKEIIAVDLYSLENLWNTGKYSFLFALENKIYAFINLFEGRRYVTLDYRTGEIIDYPDDKVIDINELRAKSYDGEFFSDAFFPQISEKNDDRIRIAAAAAGKDITGRVEFIEFNGHLFLSCHIEESRGILKNLFFVVEITTEKIIFKEVLNERTEKFVPENFFIKGAGLYLIKEKSIFKVYSLM